MRLADGKLQFGQFLPDLPELENPGLIDAKNVYPFDNGYVPFPSIGSGSGSPLAEAVRNAFTATNGGSSRIIAGTNDKLYINGTDATKTGASYDCDGGSSPFLSWQFTQYGELTIATNGNYAPQAVTYGASQFDDLSADAPTAYVVGVVGSFVVLGALDPLVGTNGSSVQWCAIDDPTDWPTPGSADAVTKQAGLQVLDPQYGLVTAIQSGDQYGLIFQERAITRMTYVGGQAVFQFDRIDSERGAAAPYSVMSIGGHAYFVSGAGFHRTNGVAVEDIGKGRVNKFLTNYCSPWSAMEYIYAAHHYAMRCVLWSTADGSAVAGGDRALKRIFIYSYADDRWTYADVTHEAIASNFNIETTAGAPLIYNSSHRLCQMNADPGTAVLTTGELEMNAGGRTHVQGVKPLVNHTSSIDATVALGAREEQDDAVTYTSEVEPHERTGFCGFRSDSRFHRVRLTLSGNFGKAMGLQFQQVPSGSV